MTPIDTQTVPLQCGARNRAHAREQRISRRITGVTAVASWIVVWSTIVSAAGPGQTHGASAPPEFLGDTSFDSSTIVSFSTGFLPELIYKKFPPDEPVVGDEVWQLGFGVLLESPAPSIDVTLQLDPAQPNPDIQILNNSATFVKDVKFGLYNNYDPLERFQISYTGTLDPFVGPIDFVLEPDGFNDVPVRVHLTVIDQPGFPLAFPTTSTFVAPAVGDITGDGKREIVVPGSFIQEGLYAFDHAGVLLPGWPFLNSDPDVLEQSFFTPTLADLDGDGMAEVIVVGSALRDAPVEGVSAGFVTTVTLYAIEGSGMVRWAVTGDFGGAPAVADLNGDNQPDIIVGGGGTLKRLTEDGVEIVDWAVETPNDILVYVPVPVIADVDGDPSNGMEIVACAFVAEPPFGAQMYVWNQDGSIHHPTWPQALGACVPPTVLDLDFDLTNGLEIVTGLDHFEDPPVDPETGFLNTFSLFAWHADGSDVSGWPHHFLRPPDVGFVDDRLIGSFAAGDVDGDGDPEIVVGTYGQGDPANGNLFLFHHDGTLDPNWPRWAGIAQTPSLFGGPALGDLDGDGLLEIVTGSFLGSYAFRANGEFFEGFPRLTAEVFAQQMLADLDADGHLEIVEISLGNRLHVWRMLTPALDPVPWPQLRQNPAHTGTMNREAGAAIPTLSGAGLAAMLCLLVCTGIIIHRKARRPIANAGGTV